MEISIVIPTIRPILNLKKLINIILNNNKIKIEIIIIHQGIRGKEIYFKDKRVKQINIHKKNLSHAKNFGIKNSKYKIITFLDDDVLINNNYLLFGIKMILKKNVSLLFGSIVTKNNNKISLNLLNKETLINYSNFLSCIASSMWINSKKYILRKKFFDQRFGLGSMYGSGEETDYVLNSLMENRKILFTPNLKVIHPNWVKRPNEIWKYAVGNGAIHKKFLNKKKLLFLRIFIKSLIISMILFVFFSLLLNKNKSNKYIIFFFGRILGFIKYKN